MVVVLDKRSSHIYSHLFQEKEVPGEPLTPQDFENAENLGKQYVYFAKTCIIRIDVVVANSTIRKLTNDIQVGSICKSQ
jgi:hypothetical protein